MINSISSSLNNAIQNFGAGKVVLVSVAVGMACYPLVKKICSIALTVLKNIYQWVSERPLSIRLHSLVCDECAQNHRQHMQKIPETINGNQ